MINWDEIDAVFFDMDGTLLDLHFDNHFWLEAVPQFYATKNNLSLMAAKKYIAKKTNAKIGSLDWYCTDYWSKILDLDIIRLKTNTQHKIKLRPFVLELLKFLENKRLILVTNAHPDTLEFKMCRIKLATFFDKMVSSHDLGLVKEHQGFWDAFQKIEPFQTNRTVFFDDSYSVLNSAKNYGFTHLFGISQPDLSAKKIKLSGFKTVDNFLDLIL